jgi:hypothetical protein
VPSFRFAERAGGRYEYVQARAVGRNSRQSADGSWQSAVLTVVRSRRFCDRVAQMSRVAGASAPTSPTELGRAGRATGNSVESARNSRQDDMPMVLDFQLNYRNATTKTRRVEQLTKKKLSSSWFLE